MELIPDVDDREFPSSKGHWTGDGEWDPGPVGGKYGLQKLPVPGDQSPVTITLQYPHIKPRANQRNSLTLNVSAKDIYADSINFTTQLTDGNYDYSFTSYMGFNKDEWLPTGDTWDLPEDWDETQATLNIIMSTEGDNDTDVVCDDFSLSIEVTAKADHLPLMGVH